jgi:poly-gamma-glutamate synthesis protein (capsule biosynthesis protein)
MRAAAGWRSEAARAARAADAAEALEAALALAADDGRPATIAAVGDLMFSRRVEARLKAEGWPDPFAAVRVLIEPADLAFANLECPLSVRGTPYPGKDPVVTFRADPRALAAVPAAGFDLVSLANNHMTDYGPDALADTEAALRAAGVAYCGAGPDAAAARAPAWFDLPAGRIAFLAFVEPIWSVVPAGAGPGVAVLDRAAAVAAIAAVRAAGADFVAVSLHWGEEHAALPRPGQRSLARALVDAGADAVIGHHPHVVQGVEFYRGAPIVYSLGNFVFDMAAPETYESMVAYLTLGSAAPPEVRLVPVRIDAASYAPRPAAGDDALAVGGLIAARCRRLGSLAEVGADGTVVVRARPRDAGL